MLAELLRDSYAAGNEGPGPGEALMNASACIPASRLAGSMTRRSPLFLAETNIPQNTRLTPPRVIATQMAIMMYQNWLNALKTISATSAMISHP